MTFTETVTKAAKGFSATGSVTSLREAFKLCRLSVIMNGKELYHCVSGDEAKKNWKPRRIISPYVPIVTAVGFLLLNEDVYMHLVPLCMQATTEF